MAHPDPSAALSSSGASGPEPWLARSRVDWARAARLLAQGHSVPRVAAAVGCARQTVARALRRSPQLRHWVEQEKASAALAPAVTLGEACRRVLAAALRNAPSGPAGAPGLDPALRALCTMPAAMVHPEAPESAAA